MIKMISMTLKWQNHQNRNLKLQFLRKRVMMVLMTLSNLNNKMKNKRINKRKKVMMILIISKRLNHKVSNKRMKMIKMILMILQKLNHLNNKQKSPVKIKMIQKMALMTLKKPSLQFKNSINLQSRMMIVRTDLMILKRQNQNYHLQKQRHLLKNKKKMILTTSKRLSQKLSKHLLRRKKIARMISMTLKSLKNQSNHLPNQPLLPPPLLRTYLNPIHNSTPLQVQSLKSPPHRHHPFKSITK